MQQQTEAEDASLSRLLVDPVPRDTWALMVHQNYVARVKDYLGSSQTCLVEGGTQGASSTKNIKKRSRTDYQVILCEQVQKPPSEQMSPLARQNISWMANMSYNAKAPTSCLTMLAKALNETCALQEMLLQMSFLLRVDVYPRHLLEPLCQALQQQATLHLIKDKAAPRRLATDDPFEGPIPMTASRTQCTARLTVLCATNNNNNTQQQQQQHYCYYWGLDQRPHDNCPF